jgi:hypothetical protein
MLVHSNTFDFEKISNQNSLLAGLFPIPIGMDTQVCITKEWDISSDEEYGCPVFYILSSGTSANPVYIKLPITSRSSKNNLIYADKTLFDNLKLVFRLENENEIKAFLENKEKLTLELLTGAKIIRQICSANLESINIKFSIDPEESYEGLFITVKLNSFSDRHSCLSAIEDKWLFKTEVDIFRYLFVRIA